MPFPDECLRRITVPSIHSSAFLASQHANISGDDTAAAAMLMTPRRRARRRLVYAARFGARHRARMSFALAASAGHTANE